MSRGPANRVAPINPEPLENRDPNDINKHIVNDFYSVFGEPTTTPRSFDCIWEFSEICYDCMKECTYKLMGLCCGICIAIAWGIEFVPIIFSHIWCLTPCTQVVHIVCGIWMKSFWHLCARLCVAPCTKSCALIFTHCGDGLKHRPETPPLFPRGPKRTPKPKPVKEEQKPVVEEKKSVAPVVLAAAAKGEWDDMDKSKIANSVKRQLML
ncbi:hypothetical protein ACF0H5_021547 [Mactra antiquata]